MRKLEKHEVMDAIRLSEYAFQYQVPEKDLEKRKAAYLKHEMWGDYDGDDLAAKLHLINFKTWIAGKQFAMGGIASVATYPEYRRGGRVAKLLRHALSEMKNKGQSISYLHPFDISFYRKFGFEVLSSWKKLKLKKEDFKPLPHVNGKVRRIPLEQVYETLNPVYETFAYRFNGMLARTEDWWKERVYSEGFLFASYTNTSGEITGYAYYQIKDHSLEIEEFVCLDGEARRGLWNYFCQHDSMIDNGTLLTHEGDPFPFLLANPKVKTKVEAYFMARIVDVESFLTDYPFTLDKNESLFLHIDDDHAEWNNGSFHIKSDGVDIYRGDKINSSCEHPPKRGLRCSINTLTAILTGYQKPEFLYEAGLLEGPEKDLELLKKTVPERETNFMDFF
ncbi:GNAT family N-acetyltransferase [Guptibacillus hwajinpoensis]|uniref:Acetyltransferase n=1 Tax=Guptibacillus hwajinpoensis TaxID=208199 RepID=A0ABU0JYF9_9BACL|nr:GNAT family N-acetyltransferase [Alkalihalobacillus hemicentroti]MDQ0482149.1 putative acetyltransferase [Alkalihalobacillus hemicentroti]